MIGAQNARILVKNQCRTKTTLSVFFVSVHVCEKMAMSALYAPVGLEVSCLKPGSVEVDRCVQWRGHGAQDQRGNNSRMVGRIEGIRSTAH
jgi:hypothetical protein